MGNNKNEWKRLYNKKGILVYEGFTKNNKPCGAGTSYYSNGTIFQEGIFGVKGFLCGREYYQSGKLRFEGVCELNRNYGPNYPRYGFFQTEDGSLTYEGEFKLSFGGVGYPTVKKPGEYGAIRSRSDVDIPVLMWEDEKSGNDSDKHETHADQDETMPTFEEFKAAVEKDYLVTQNTEVSRRYINTKEAQDKIKRDYASYAEKFKKVK